MILRSQGFYNSKFLRSQGPTVFDFVVAQIEMASHDAAAQTIAKLNGTLFQEKKINMSWKQGDYKQRTLTETKLYVKGIKREVDQNKLQQVFDKYGNTLSVKLGTNEKNESNGYGIVEYCSVEEVNKVIESKEVQYPKKVTVGKKGAVEFL